MSQVGSVTEWIARLKAGDKDASQELWQRYVERLARLARTKLGRTSRRVRDEDDVVISVFDGLFRGVEAGRFPRLDDRDDLWQVLVMLTTRRAIDHRRRERAADAGGGKVQGESAFAGPQDAESAVHGISQVVDGEPTPEFAVQSAEELERLLGLLEDDILRRIAMGKAGGAYESGNRPEPRQPQIEDFLNRVVEAGRESLLRELLCTELEFHRDKGASVDIDQYRQRFPDDAPIVADAFSCHARTGHWNPTGSTQNDVAAEDSIDGGGRARPQDGDQATIPRQIGRYIVRRSLGRGAFGDVYLAHDPDLDRLVALKTPREHLFATPAAVDVFLAEARTAARLDHPGIVRVYDVSRDSGRLVIVLEYVEGSTLKDAMASEQFSPERIAEVISGAADAVDYANRAGLVHRDLKPDNILIDAAGRPRVADFGLAIHEDVQRLRKGERAGSPAYMAPEQVRRESHRLDGRTDQWSLGVILYELLTGRRPFRGDSEAELYDEIDQRDPKPPRQIAASVPAELERICLKCLSKRMSDRYPTVGDLAADLRCWLETGQPQATGPVTRALPETDKTVPIAAAETQQPPRIVPKGLRSFDEHDADFFLELLPGPRDRDGLPDSIRFWKTRIEEADADRTFSVGLIYGPSGCGKSSLVKAGLLPRLSGNVSVVYVEATAADTEVRLLNGLRKHSPEIPKDMPLPEVFANLREGRWLPRNKMLIVLDQFEQWLHARGGELKSQLIDALRHCDGGRVQCIVLVRDDFWMAATRFFRSLDVRLVEADNSAAVDLFDVDHARNVLTAFGRAFGRIPEHASENTSELQDFLKQSVAGLSDDGKVICVRLALFAEMMKGRPWTPAALKEVGGTTGIGVTFLEETFSASGAPPEHRYHQKAARAVLKDLLPESGTNIKGHMRSHAELLAASGSAGRPQDFDDLLRILDSELRLITPTDPVGMDLDDDVVPEAAGGQKYYQLTHDYLVPALRDWLTRKQRETRRGRAELRLAERSESWNSKPENRRLPSWWELLNIRLLTDTKKWTQPQRKMLRRAGRVHGVRSLLILVGLIGVVSGGIALNHIGTERQNDAEATRLVEGLLAAKPAEVSAIIDNLEDYHTWAHDDLTAAFSKSPDDSDAKLHAALALLPADDAALEFLRERLLTVSPQQFAPVRDLLSDHRPSLSGEFWPKLIADYWSIAADAGQEPPRRFQAACALASYDPQNAFWQDEELARFVAMHLSGVQLSELLPWRNALRPVRQHLTAPLGALFRNQGAREQVRGFATDTLADYLSDDPQGLFDLLADANETQFRPVFDQLEAHPDQAVVLANAEVSRTLPQDVGEDDKEALALRRANAAVMLLRMGAPDAVWPLLRHSPDPRVRSDIIHRLGPLGADPAAIIARYEKETDVTIQRALLLSLGEFDATRLSESARAPLMETLLTVYRTHPDAGLHAAARGCSESGDRRRRWPRWTPNCGKTRNNCMPIRTRSAAGT